MTEEEVIKQRKSNRGQVPFMALIVAVLVTVVALTIVPLMVVSTIPGCISRLEDRGYVVLASGEYSSLYDISETLLLHNENETFLFPDSVSANVSLTAGAPADTFGAWAELVDSGAVTLSSKFATKSGYLVEIMLRDYSDANEIYIIEVATANDGTNVVGRDKVRSDWTYIRAFRSARIEAGVTLYYRMKAESAGATVNADFRYYYR